MIKVTPLGGWLSHSAEGAVAWRGAQTLSRQHWRQQILALGQRLLKQPAQRWALCFDDSYLFSIALVATLHAGKTPVIPGHCRESLLQEQVGEFDAVLTDIPLTIDCPVWSVTGAEDASSARSLPPIDAAAHIVLFTSGSTGKPKQIIKPVSCLDEEIRWLAERWHDRLARSRVIASVSHQHLYGLTFRIILPLALGLPFDSSQIFYSEQLSARERAFHYVFISSPAFLKRLDYSLPAPDCRLIVSAGGALPWKEAQGVETWLKQPVDEIYGSTETGVLASRRRTTQETLWQPFNGIVFSESAQQRWRVTSPLIPDPQGLLLDDKLFFTADGFQLCGRHDRVVKIEDKRISLSEIERRLLALPQVADAVALAVSRPERNGIGAVLVLRDVYGRAELAQLKRQWRQELHRWLEPVAMPRYWRVVGSIPQNSQSKRAWPQIQELFYVAR